MMGSIRKSGKQNWQMTIHVGVRSDGKYLRHYETLTLGTTVPLNEL